MKRISLLLLICLFSFQCMAVTPIKKGEEAQEDGYVFSKEEEREIRNINDQKIKLEDLNVLKDKKIELQELRLDGYKKYVDETKDLAPMGTWEKIGWFFLGVGVTGAGFYATSKIIRNTTK